MGFLDDKENTTKEENINGAECERKQGNDEGSSLQKRRRTTVFATEALVSTLSCPRKQQLQN